MQTKLYAFAVEIQLKVSNFFLRVGIVPGATKAVKVWLPATPPAVPEPCHMRVERSLSHCCRMQLSAKKEEKTANERSLVNYS